MVAVKAEALRLYPHDFPYRESYPVRSHKTVLRHAVAKHDPNAGRRDVLLLCDRTYSRKHNRNISNRRK